MNAWDRDIYVDKPVDPMLGVVMYIKEAKIAHQNPH